VQRSCVAGILFGLVCRYAREEYAVAGRVRDEFRIMCLQLPECSAACSSEGKSLDGASKKSMVRVEGG
jgi:hypothetical protein